jgi:integrase
MISARAIGGKQMYWINPWCSANTKLAKYRHVQITEAARPIAARALGRLNGRWCFNDAKRSRSRRLIRVQNWVVVLLRELHTTTTAAPLVGDPCSEATDLVFKTRSGYPINADCLTKRFKSILELAGLPKIRLYDLRHTAATLALAAGVPAKVVAEQLGHASVAFTLDTDARVLPHMQDAAAAKFETMLFVEPICVAA